MTLRNLDNEKTPDRSEAVKVQMQVEAWIIKGTRVRVGRLVADLRTCLAGVQMKQSCTAEDWVGTVTPCLRRSPYPSEAGVVHGPAGRIDG